MYCLIEIEEFTQRKIASDLFICVIVLKGSNKIECIKSSILLNKSDMRYSLNNANRISKEYTRAITY